MVKSFKGREVDMQALAIKNEKTVAIGNANMNAKGDILGKGGKIIKTREDIIKEYYEANNIKPEIISLKSDKVSQKQEEAVAKDVLELIEKTPNKPENPKKSKSSKTEDLKSNVENDDEIDFDN